MRGVRDAEVVGRMEPQLGIHAGLAARVEQELLRGLELALRDRGHALVVDVARGAMLATAAGDQHHHDQRSHHEALRSPAPAATHSAPSKNTRQPRTSHWNRSAGTRRTAASDAARTIGAT